MNSYRRLAALAALVAVAACTEQSDPVAPPVAEIVDGAHNAGNQHFYFLPPMVRTPFYTGTFDATLAPEVEICEWGGSSCGTIVARFSTTSGTGSEIIRVDTGDELYIVNWHTRTDDLDPAKTYRIRVLVGSRELGHADVDVVATGRELRNVNTDEYIALLDDRTLPIKFRIEDGAIPAEDRTVVGGGNAHTCALGLGGAAYCWGYNWAGQLGDGSYTNSTLPVAVLGGHVFASLAVGAHHTCALDENGAAWCWGAGTSGALGNGLTANRTTPVAVSGGHAFTRVVAGSNLTCGLRTDGVALCWGYNQYGSLGVGSFVSTVTVPTPVAGGLTFQSLDAFYLHTCGVTTTGAGYCWGYNWYGGLGNASVSQTSPYGTNTPVPVAGGHTWSSIQVGALHSCGLDTDGAAMCWGFNYYGSVGAGGFTVTPPYAIPTPTAVSGGLTFGSLSAGGQHTCGLTAGGTAHCWGYNYYGNLGTGTFQQSAPYGIAQPVAVVGGDTWAALGVGWNHSCGVTVVGQAKCWGYNFYGGLGNGAVSQSPPYASATNSQPGVVGGALTFEVP